MRLGAIAVVGGIAPPFVEAMCKDVFGQRMTKHSGRAQHDLRRRGSTELADLKRRSLRANHFTRAANG
jgi:hypothetical protein